MKKSIIRLPLKSCRFSSIKRQDIFRVTQVESVVDGFEQGRRYVVEGQVQCGETERLVDRASFLQDLKHSGATLVAQVVGSEVQFGQVAFALEQSIGDGAAGMVTYFQVV